MKTNVRKILMFGIKHKRKGQAGIFIIKQTQFIIWCTVLNTMSSFNFTINV